MDATSYHDIKSSLRQLYLKDPRPRLVGLQRRQKGGVPPGGGDGRD